MGRAVRTVRSVTFALLLLMLLVTRAHAAISFDRQSLREEVDAVVSRPVRTAEILLEIKFEFGEDHWNKMPEEARRNVLETLLRATPEERNEIYRQARALDE